MTTPRPSRLEPDTSPLPSRALLRLGAVDGHVETLGPKPNVTIWTQGCSIGRVAPCTGCMSPETWSRTAGALAFYWHVADWVISTGQRHLVISGGEPTDQAPVLVLMIDYIRAKQDVTVTLYTGYRREALEAGARPGAAELLERVDLLIDGRYRPSEHAPLLWRGSRNQRLHVLSDRIELPADEHAGVQLSVKSDGTFSTVGVWPEAGANDTYEAQLAQSGDFEPVEDPQFPFPTQGA